MRNAAATALFLLLAAAPVRAAAGFPYALDTGREIALAGGGALLLGLGARAAAGLPPLTDAELAALDPAELPALDRVAVGRWSPAADAAGDALAWTLAAAPVAQMAAGPGRERAGRLALMYAETVLLAQGTTALVKNAVRRPRPFAYGADPRVPAALRRAPTACRSFPSGHTAQAFASMVFFAATFARLQPESDARPWVWGGCLGAAATTGWLRVAAGRHFPTDVLAGAVLGAAAGWLVPRLHEPGAGSAGAGAAPVRVAVGFAF